MPILTKHAVLTKNSERFYSIIKKPDFKSAGLCGCKVKFNEIILAPLQNLREGDSGF